MAKKKKTTTNNEELEADSETIEETAESNTCDPVPNQASAAQIDKAPAGPTPGPSADDGDDDDEAEGEGEGGEGSKKKKKKKKNKPKVSAAKKQRQEMEKYCQEVLAGTKARVEGITEPLKIPEIFNGFSWTGMLRPAVVTPQVTVPANIVEPDYARTGKPISEMEAKKAGATVEVYSGDDLEKLRHACRMAREVLDVGGSHLKVGVSGDEIDRIVHQATIDRGGYPSPLNYHHFPKSVCVSPNEVICHGIPDMRPIEEGDIVNLDVTVYIDGFHADLNETYLIGKCDEESIHLVKCAYECLQAACAMIKPGTMYRELGPVISHVAASHSCSVVKSYCGHGIGRLFHTAPNVPHYAKNKAVGIMRPGHVFTIEPMINASASGADKTWPDNWTAVTTNGKRSSQFEHTFLVTETGVDILTARQGASRTEMVWDIDAIQR